MVYDKENHFIDSFSVWLDLDSCVYIIVILLIAWGVTRLVQKTKKKDKISLLKFTSKYMIFCSLPIFVLFAVQLIMSGLFVANNIIVTFLPLIYGAIIQLICHIIVRHRNHV